MRNGYVTKRYPPKGYVAVTKPLAEKLYNEGKTITICGSNVNDYHVFQGWHLGCPIDNTEGIDFGEILNSFLYYLNIELGRYAVFYVKRSDL